LSQLEKPRVEECIAYIAKLEPKEQDWQNLPRYIAALQVGSLTSGAAADLKSYTSQGSPITASNTVDLPIPEAQASILQVCIFVFFMHSKSCTLLLAKLGIITISIHCQLETPSCGSSSTGRAKILMMLMRVLGSSITVEFTLGSCIGMYISRIYLNELH